jgi:hypothetical protein
LKTEAPTEEEESEPLKKPKKKRGVNHGRFQTPSKKKKKKNFPP